MDGERPAAPVPTRRDPVDGAILFCLHRALLCAVVAGAVVGGLGAGDVPGNFRRT